MQSCGPPLLWCGSDCGSIRFIRFGPPPRYSLFVSNLGWVETMGSTPLSAITEYPLCPKWNTADGPIAMWNSQETFLLISDGSFFIQPGHSVTKVTQDWYPRDYCDTVTWAEWKNKTWWSPISAGLCVKSPCRRLFRLIHFKEIRMEAEKWVGKCISITRQGAAPPKHCPPTKLHCK